MCGNKMPTRCNRGFYCRSYCLLNTFGASLCPSSGAQEYYTVVAACGISCCKNVKNNFVSFCGICVEQAIRSAIKTSVASSWHFISTYQPCMYINWPKTVFELLFIKLLTKVATLRKFDLLSDNFNVIGIFTSKRKEFNLSFMWSYLVDSPSRMYCLIYSIMSYQGVPVWCLVLFEHFECQQRYSQFIKTVVTIDISRC